MLFGHPSASEVKKIESIAHIRCFQDFGNDIKTNFGLEKYEMLFNENMNDNITMRDLNQDTSKHLVY